MSEVFSADIVTDARSIGLDPVALDRLCSTIEGDIARGLHHGAVILVARGGRVGLHRAIGMSDKVKGRTASLDDRFWLASTGKALTAAAVLKFIDQGRLSFSTRVSEVIPEFAVRGKQRVEVWHLLNHTGGTWSGFLPPPPLQWGPDAFNLKKYVAAVSAQSLTHRQGERVIYNPFADYAVLGEMLHRVDGRSFREIMQSEIFDPLRMTESACGLPVGKVERVPVQMTDFAPGAAEAAVMHSFNQLLDESAELPAGGFYATTRDVFRFSEVLRRRGSLGSEKLLSPAILDYALKNHTGEKPSDFWDFSKEARDIAQFPANFDLLGGYVRGVGHYLSPYGFTASPETYGAVGSGSTMFFVDPARDLTFVFLSAGLMEGLGHFQRLQRLSDLALATAA